MFKRLSIFVTAVSLLACSCARAHRPIFTDEKGIDPETAVKIATPDVSQVIYRSLTDETPQLWLQLEAKEGFELFVQIGIPVINRLKEYRPSFVVLGPGMNEIDLPFVKPKGLGGKNFATTDVDEPRFFHEHFTKTDSWILKSETIKLPSSGKYYIVAYSPTDQKDKLWLSVGKKEKFGVMDILSFGGWKKTIQKFHEVSKANSKSMLIDDFSDPNRDSALGTKWRLITDRVMGGVSNGDYRFGKDKRFGFINMTGNVSLENNGGFVQVALPLSKTSEPIDASKFNGVRLWVKGNQEKYYIHLKDSQTQRPWQYYSADFLTTKDWRKVEIPFEKFKPNALSSEMAADSLNRIAIVAAKKAHKVDISVGQISFYKKAVHKKTVNRRR